MTLIVVLSVLAVLVLGGGTAALVVRGRQSAALPKPAVRPELAQPATVDAPAEPEIQPSIETPESSASRLTRLKQRLAGSNALGRGLLALISRDQLDDATWESIEDLLIGSDLGVKASTELVETVRTRLRVEGGDARSVLKDELVNLLDPAADRRLRVSGEDGKPGIVLVVGVNGAGKTTTVGKLARILVAEDRTVILGAADTFRAAAADQLETWGSRVGVEVVRGAEGADPSSVAFDAAKDGVDHGLDTVIIDTAGRLQNKQGLMDELGKVKRVTEKQAPVTETLLVLDATTGQNGLVQARVFNDAVEITGVVLTKLDGSAKGGIVVQVQQELGVPVKLVGLGEGPDDLAPFSPEAFVDALLG